MSYFEGTKRYRTQHERDVAYHNQTWLHERMLAPRCWEPFYIEDWFCYHTEVVEVCTKVTDKLLEFQKMAQGFYHDMKPENLGILRGQVVIIDTGLPLRCPGAPKEKKPRMEARQERLFRLEV